MFLQSSRPNEKEMACDNVDLKRTFHKKTISKSFDCSIMDVADDIAYSIHDIEDAINYGLIVKSDFKEQKEILEIFEKKKHNDWIDVLFSDKEYERKAVLGGMIHTLIKKIYIKENKSYKSPILKYSIKFKSDAKKAVECLKDIVKTKVIKSQEIQSIVFGGMMTVMQLFDALIANPDKLLSNDYRNRMTEENKYRCVSDYISGMTDEYARRLHKRIYGDDPRSVFEKL